MNIDPKKLFIFILCGSLLSLVILVLLLIRYNDTGFIGIVMTIVCEVIFVFIGVYATSYSAEHQTLQNTTTTQLGGKKYFRQMYKPMSIVLLTFSVLIATLALTVLFDAFNSQLNILIETKELHFTTPRADQALRLTIGGYFALIFWIPFILVASFWVGQKSEALSFWECSLAVLLSIGLYILANITVEIFNGSTSVEIILGNVFNQPKQILNRVQGEKMFFSLMFATSFIIAWSALSSLIMISAWLGKRWG